MELRKELIRLAHKHPEFRKDLIPLLDVKGSLSKESAGLPRDFDLESNPIKEMKLISGFKRDGDKMVTSDKRFSLVATNTLDTQQRSQIKSISANDTVALCDIHGVALSCGSPKDIAFNIKSTDRKPWTDVRASLSKEEKKAAISKEASGTWGRRIAPVKEQFMKEIVQEGLKIFNTEGVTDARPLVNSIEGVLQGQPVSVLWNWVGEDINSLMRLGLVRRTGNHMVLSRDPMNVAAESIYKHFQGLVP